MQTHRSGRAEADSGRFPGPVLPTFSNLSRRFADTEVLRQTKNRRKGRETVPNPIAPHRTRRTQLGRSETATSYSTAASVPTAIRKNVAFFQRSPANRMEPQRHTRLRVDSPRSHARRLWRDVALCRLLVRSSSTRAASAPRRHCSPVLATIAAAASRSSRRGGSCRATTSSIIYR
jgi:hypothetical protein